MSPGAPLALSLVVASAAVSFTEMALAQSSAPSATQLEPMQITQGTNNTPANVAPSAAPPPALPPPPPFAHGALARPRREASPENEALAASMRVATRMLGGAARDAQVAELVTGLGMGAGAVLSGGVIIAVRSDLLSTLVGTSFLVAGGATLAAVPLAYLISNSRRTSLFAEYEALAQRGASTDELLRAIELRWSTRASEAHRARMIGATALGVFAAFSLGFGLWMLADTRSFPSSGASSMIPLAALLGTLSASSLGSAIWLGLTPSATERSLEYWRQHGAPPPQRGLEELQLSPFITPQSAGVGLSGSFR